MNEVDVRLARSAEVAIPVNKVLKNTYLLLSMTLAFSAFCRLPKFQRTAAQSLDISYRCLWIPICNSCFS